MFQLIFVATRGDAYSGDIAIDNLNIRTGSCRWNSYINSTSSVYANLSPLTWGRDYFSMHLMYSWSLFIVSYYLYTVFYSVNSLLKL